MVNNIKFLIHFYINFRHRCLCLLPTGLYNIWDIFLELLSFCIYFPLLLFGNPFHIAIWKGTNELKIVLYNTWEIKYVQTCSKFCIFLILFSSKFSKCRTLHLFQTIEYNRRGKNSSTISISSLSSIIWMPLK